MNHCLKYKARVLKSILIIIQTLLIIFLSSCTDFIADIDKQKDWKILESGKIVLHYRPKDFSSSPSPTLEEAGKIAKNQNFYYQVVQDSINRSFNDKVLIYLYNRDEAEEMIGTNGGGHSIPKLNTFYYTFIPNRPDFRDKYEISNPIIGAHELAHVISHRSLGYPGTKLMSEGYANWLDGSYSYHSITNIMRTYKEQKSDKIMSPNQLLNKTTENEAVYYPNCGLFIQYLVKEYGINNINNLFTITKDNYKNKFENVTGDSWDEMTQKYNNYLDKIL